MKKIAMSVLAVAGLAAAANAQIEFRLVERNGQTMVNAGTTPAASPGAGTANDASIFLILEARVAPGTVGPANIEGLGGFGLNVVTTDAFGTGGSFKTTGSTQTPGLQVNGVTANTAGAPGYTAFQNADGDPLPSGRGIFNPFRVVAQLGDTATGVANPVDPVGFNGLYGVAGATGSGEYGSVAAGTANRGQFGLDTWVPIYIFGYDVTDFTARTLTFTVTGAGQTFIGIEGGAPVPGPEAPIAQTYSVAVVPAPGAAALLGLGGLVAARRRRN